MFASAVALALVTLEAAVGLWLVVGVSARLAAAAACVLLVSFAVAQLTVLARGMSIGCGCFGRTESVSRGTTFRTSLLAVAALLVVAVDPALDGVPLASRALVALAASLASLLMLETQERAAMPMLVGATRSGHE
jgi:hypothetical protein